MMGWHDMIRTYCITVFAAKGGKYFMKKYENFCCALSNMKKGPQDLSK